MGAASVRRLRVQVCTPCKLIDLGRWLGGRHRIEIPVEATERDVASEESSADHPEPEGTP
jgi:endogenous inhibitor of DNA gyrase (YacG/DUF329 family)